MSKIAIIPNLLDVLPFRDALTWEKFQSLAADYLLIKYDNAREYGDKGDKQHGIDAYAYTSGEEEMRVAQCKLKDYLSPKQVLDIIDLFTASPLMNVCKEFILCTSANLSRHHDEEETIRQSLAKLAVHGIDFKVWDEKGLSAELRTHPSERVVGLVYRYFGETVTLHFFGEIWKNHVKKMNVVKKKPYTGNNDHISRTIVSYTARLEPGVRWELALREAPVKPTLRSLFENRAPATPFQVILLSTAGFGKSEEISQLASAYAIDDYPVYPAKFSLKNYGGQAIITLLDGYEPEWRNIPEPQLLLLLDGFDEIPESFVTTFIRELNGFLEHRPMLPVIVSSRYNFYDLVHHPLSPFQVYLLDPLTNKDVRNYIDDKLRGERDDFLGLLNHRSFHEYLSNPYYLTRLVRFYGDKTIDFPANKTELFDRILFEQLQKAETIHTVTGLRALLTPVAEHIAFCMTLTGKSSLTEEEMKGIVPDLDLRDALKHYSILNRTGDAVPQWSFEHKNLQEYLCGAVFARLSFTELHSILSFAFEPNKMQPRFINTISFLFEIIDHQSPVFGHLFDWINTHEPELLVRFEKERLTASTRLSILQNIYKIYKNKQVTFRISGNFHHDELARFVGLEEPVLQFLMDEVAAGLEMNLVYDTLDILEYTEHPFRFRSKLEPWLLQLLRDKQQPVFVHSKVIYCLSELGYTGATVWEAILHSGIDVTQRDTRLACLSFLSKGNMALSCPEFIVDSISIVCQPDRTESVSLPNRLLIDLMLQLNTPETFQRVLRYAVSEPGMVSNQHSGADFYFEIADVKQFLETAARLLPEAPGILPRVYRIFCSIPDISFSEAWFPLFKDFFERTCGHPVIFQKFYQHGRRRRELMAFADQAGCQMLIREYTEGRLSADDLFICRNQLSHLNPPLCTWFLEQLAPVDGGRFVEGIDHTDYAAVRAAQAVKNEQMLQDGSLFLDEAGVIFDILGKETISFQDILEANGKTFQLYQYSIVLAEIRKVCTRGSGMTLSRADFLANYADPVNWAAFLVRQVRQLLSDKKTVPASLLALAQDWCRAQLQEANFEFSITDGPGGTHSCNTRIESLKKVYLAVRPELDDALLVRMLSADYQSFTSSKDMSPDVFGMVVISKIRDQAMLRRQLLANLKHPGHSSLVKKSHFQLCHHLKLRECLEPLYLFILQDKVIRDYERVQLTEYYVDLGGRIGDFSSAVTEPEEDGGQDGHPFTRWYWHLIEQLLIAGTPGVHALCTRMIGTDRSMEKRRRAANLLLQVRDPAGFMVLAEHLKSSEEPDYTFHLHRLEPLVVQLDPAITMPLLMDLLEECYRKGRHAISHDGLINFTINVLAGIARTDHALFLDITGKLNALANASGDLSVQNSLRYFLENMTRHYYGAQHPVMEIPAANELYHRFLPQRSIAFT